MKAIAKPRNLSRTVPRDGLKPAGTQGYFQPVKFNTKELDESDSSLTLVRDGKDQALELGKTL